MLLRGNLITNPPGTSVSSPVTDRIRRDSVIRGLVYAHENGAQVINMSLGTFIVRESVIGDCDQRGVQGVPADKFTVGIQKLAAEWEMRLGSLQRRAVLVIASPNCGSLNLESPDNYFYPGGYVRPRPDLGVGFVHQTMVTVTTATVWDEFNGRLFSFPMPSTITPRGPRDILMAAPGDNWRVLDAQNWSDLGRVGISTGTTMCTGGRIRRCQGASLAAPLVAGTAALVLANNGMLTAVEVRQRLLDNAQMNRNFTNTVENARFLDVAAAVGP